MVFEVILLSSDGSTFRALGAAAMNALSAVRVLVLGMTKSLRFVERSRSLVRTLHRSARYAGGEPYFTSNITDTTTLL